MEIRCARILFPVAHNYKKKMTYKYETHYRGKEAIYIYLVLAFWIGCWPAGRMRSKDQCKPYFYVSRPQGTEGMRKMGALWNVMSMCFVIFKRLIRSEYDFTFSFLSKVLFNGKETATLKVAIGQRNLRKTFQNTPTKPNHIILTFFLKFLGPITTLKALVFVVHFVCSVWSFWIQ